MDHQETREDQSPSCIALTVEPPAYTLDENNMKHHHVAIIGHRQEVIYVINIRGSQDEDPEPFGNGREGTGSSLV